MRRRIQRKVATAKVRAKRDRAQRDAMAKQAEAGIDFISQHPVAALGPKVGFFPALTRKLQTIDGDELLVLSRLAHAADGCPWRRPQDRPHSTHAELRRQRLKAGAPPRELRQRRAILKNLMHRRKAQQAKFERGHA